MKHFHKHPSVLRTTIEGSVFFGSAVVAGYFAGNYLLAAVIASLLKFAMGIIAIVWLFSLTVYSKLSEVTDLSGLDYHQHRNIEIEIRARLQWFWLRAIFLGLLALTMYVPTILDDAKLKVPVWVVEGAFGALSLAIFSLRRLWNELEEIRELKSHIKELERREKERAEQVKMLKDGLKEEWKSDALLDGFRISPPNDADSECNKES